MKIPFPVMMAGVTLGMVLYACGSDGPGFGGGGSSIDDTLHTPGGDTDETDTGDTGEADTGDTSEPIDTSEPDDTAPPVDTSPPYTGEGYGRGDVAYNLVAPSHVGVEWNLYEHGGRPVVLVLGYGQSYTFQDICSWLPEIRSEFSSYGVETAVMLYLDEYGADADQEAAARWAAAYGLNVVLYDPDYEVRGAWSNTTQVKTYLIDEDMVITWDNLESTSREQLRQQIGDLVY
jgi:hypothetical protein